MTARRYRITLHMPQGPFAVDLDADDDQAALTETRAFAAEVGALAFSLKGPTGAVLADACSVTDHTIRSTEETVHA